MKAETQLISKRVLVYLIIILLILINSASYSQSSSVFDASYFEGNSTPPIKPGRGFHINDIYRQTRVCFTPETSGTSKLVAQQSGGRKTTIKMFYTRTNAEYNDLRKRGRSGKVSFLNLFSAGGEFLNQYANTTILDKERLVFMINVDFGVFGFNQEPTLTAEAKGMIAQHKLKEFVAMYGTHYISGVRKESSIVLVLTKSATSYQSNNVNSFGFGAGANVPLKGSGSFEIEDGEWINQQLRTSNYDVKIEVNGPAINQQTLQQSISKILAEGEGDKIQAISSMLSAAAKDLGDPDQAMISQYYYTPYSLYGLEGIYWDQKKEKELMQVNEAIIKVYSAKTKLDELLKASGKRQIETELRNNKVPDEYIDKISTAYSEAQPKFRQLRTAADGYLQQLETRYAACSDVFCERANDCCSNTDLLSEINNDQLDEQLYEAIGNLMKVAIAVKKDMEKPDCEKLHKGTVIVQNVSANPYDLYSGDHYLGTLQGNGSMSFTVDKGSYGLKAVQKSGYVFYATVNKRTAVISRSCQEVKVTIGYEDK